MMATAASKTLTLESPACAFCGQRDTQPLYGDHFKPYQVVQCRQCQLVYLSPRLEEAEMLARYAREDYFGGEGDGGYESYIAQETTLRLTYAALLKDLSRQGMTGGSLLEIGCGHGYFLQEASTYFSSLTGTDFSSGALDRAKAYGDAHYLGGIDSVPAKARFDMIVAHQVIEHIYDPPAFLKQLADHLNPGGRLILTTPDAGSFWRRWMGRRWPSYKLPEHILFFTHQTLGAFLTRAGYTQVMPFPYVEAFPLFLVASKFGLKITGTLGQTGIRLPATSLAIVAQKP